MVKITMIAILTARPRRWITEGSNGGGHQTGEKSPFSLRCLHCFSIQMGISRIRGREDIIVAAQAAILLALDTPPSATSICGFI
ncbi:hypothetical protein DPEC_G00145410 [Dallia pectoralis]|uniref:Uncharacterized protein n=1 Tax=Dallia pectoralis TaxID=75939 RepID=A0ACC2GNT7_DALPE|nr:hypothetical protein DPEC_G00145410 [Dallia pectoralis]